MNPYHDPDNGRFTSKNGSSSSEQTVLPKGSKLNSISSTENSRAYLNRPRWMYTYRDDDEWDNRVYKGPFSIYLVRDRGERYVAEHKFETVKDLVMPTKEQRLDEFKRLHGKDLTRDLKEVRDELLRQQIGSEQELREYKNIDLDNLKTDDDWRIAYNVFSHAMEASGYFRSTREYVKAMSSKYDAMVDDNNKDVYNRAHDPIIIFRAREALKSLTDDKGRMLTAQEINSNAEYVRKELKKLGEKMKL